MSNSAELKAFKYDTNMNSDEEYSAGDEEYDIGSDDGENYGYDDDIFSIYSFWLEIMF